MEKPKFGGLFISTDKEGNQFLDKEHTIPYVEPKPPKIKATHKNGKFKETQTAYWECPRCNINTIDDGHRMIPCPRGGCEAQSLGLITTKSTLKLK